MNASRSSQSIILEQNESEVIEKFRQKNDDQNEQNAITIFNFNSKIDEKSSHIYQSFYGSDPISNNQDISDFIKHFEH